MGAWSCPKEGWTKLPKKVSTSMDIIAAGKACVKELRRRKARWLSHRFQHPEVTDGCFANPSSTGALAVWFIRKTQTASAS